MAPSMLLLKRQTGFSHDEAELGGRSIPSPWRGMRGLGKLSREELRDLVTQYLKTFKARLVVADPPEISSLRLLPPNSDPLPPLFKGLDSFRISSADKNLVALYAGGYRPGSSSLGGYLIYDATMDSVSVIPPIPSDDSHTAMGNQSAVVKRSATGDDYLLAELVWVTPGFSKAALWLWKSSAKEWALHPQCLPIPSNNAPRYFSVHSCFSCQDSILCWVDLHKGMVLCDLHQGCNLIFISLPQGYPNYDAGMYPPGLCAEEFRSVACVRGSIKFLAFNKFVERQPGEEFGLTVWTLLSDYSGWKVSYKRNVSDIWANANYQSAGLKQLAPLFPVLSIHEDGVVYLVLNDTSEVDGRLVFKTQYLIRFDMANKEVQIYPQRTRHIYSQLFASEFSAHRQSLQDHPREMEPSEFAASGKRMKT